MNCAKARANLSAYVEQELSEKDRREVSTHLGRCEDCSRDLFAMQKAINLLRWIPRADARPGFEERLRRRLRTETAPPGRWAWLSDRLRSLGEALESPGLRAVFGESLALTPASALFLALLFGTGGGALIMHQVMREPGTVPSHAAATPEIMSAPSASRMAASTTGPGSGPVPGGPGTEPAAPAVEPELAALAAPKTDGAGVQPAAVGPAADRSPSKSRTSRAPVPAPILTAAAPPAGSSTRPRSASQVEVAPWATNQQPIEGPPAVSQVEYILDLVDVNQERVLQLPSTVVVSGSTVTF
jgi:anti-sigma factor RsiW